MNEKDPYIQLPEPEDSSSDEEDNSSDEEGIPEDVYWDMLANYFSEYHCPVCPGGGWTMQIYEGGDVIEINYDESFEVPEGETYLLCPNCDVYFPEQDYDSY